MTIILFACLPLFLIGVGAFAVRLAEGTITEMVALVGALSALVGTLIAGVVAIINARSNARIKEMQATVEDHKKISEDNSRQIAATRNDVAINTMVTEQAKEAVQSSIDQGKVRVEELTKAVDDLPKQNQ